VYGQDITIVTKGLLKHLSGPKIADMLDKLVLNKDGSGFVGYEAVHN
jgi:hypothetical protein